MDKRYQVFVSSTFVDLIDERQEIMQALLELDCIPAGMELFSAADDDQWTLIKRVIDDCDYYVLVLGGRYGSIGPDGLSYTQMEYEYAVAQGKPVIGFLHKDPGSIIADKTEKSPEGKEKLLAFREKVQKKLCKFWETPTELGSVVSRSLVKLIKDKPGIGWVKGDQVPDKTSTEEILALRKEIDRLKSELAAKDIEFGKDTEQFMQGDDELVINYSWKSQNPENPFNFDGWTSEFSLTWDYIFSALSPLMIDEASELVLKQEVNKLARPFARKAMDDDKETKDRAIKDVTVDPDDFNTIKIQLLALKLIEKSNKKKNRGVSDKATYWTLTPHGETTMMTLRALRRE